MFGSPQQRKQRPHAYNIPACEFSTLTLDFGEKSAVESTFLDGQTLKGAFRGDGSHLPRYRQMVLHFFFETCLRGFRSTKKS